MSPVKGSSMCISTWRKSLRFSKIWPKMPVSSPRTPFDDPTYSFYFISFNNASPHANKINSNILKLIAHNLHDVFLIYNQCSNPLNLSSMLESMGDYSTESILLFVNYVLKELVSVLDPNFGTNGAFIFFYSSSLKFIFENHGWFIIYLPPLWPSLFFGSLTKSLLKRSCS